MSSISTVGKSEKCRPAAPEPPNIKTSLGNFLQSRCNFPQGERPLQPSILCPEGTVLCERNDDGGGARQYTTLTSKEEQADHRGLGPRTHAA